MTIPSIIGKKMKKANRVAILAVVLSGFLGCGGCSSTSETTDLPFERSSQAMAFSSLWQEELPGPITDLALAKKSGDLVVASIPDADSGGKHLLTLFSKAGKKVFQIPSPFPVKSLDIADDGSRVIVSNYDGKLLSYDRAGSVSWTAEGGCRPWILNTSKKIICYHDDDTKPSFAYDAYDFDGKRVGRFPIKTDVLALKISDDEKWFAVALAGGRVLVFGNPPTGDFKAEKDWKVPGEILDVSISSGEEPTLATISIDMKKGETLSIFEARKREVASMRLSYHVEQVETFPSGKLVAVYGNSPRGQYIAVHSGYDGTLQWQKLDPRYADYSLAIRVGEDKILAGFEQVKSAGASGATKTRSSKLVALDRDGKMRADLPLKTAEGAYLYSFAYSSDRSLMGVGTDDKRVQLLELK
jgi:outer membrane protein assembly factor BamB